MNDEYAFVCPHCGGVLFDMTLRPYQEYEVKVARWLHGKLVSPGQKAFDVWQCQAFPYLTFQVKFANLGPPQYHGGFTGQRFWSWGERPNKDDVHADYYILCGLRDDYEFWFVMSRDDFVKRSGGNKRGERRLQGNPDSKGVLWQYRCIDPEKMVEHILRREEAKQLGLL